ncbi:hypothetical protein Ate02nite_70340 [Paractinoplanes tereljensis]|uniref:Uncharacterized protein n=1 Tax=Paractinoplanes tereljensis TaxID=571912 RepID=A0A919TWE6_9ACTN|nr:hypothetical protein Ate02nite_70340 [Actinoplanes tereljensis]
MRSSAEPQIDGSIPNIIDVPWSKLMTEGSDALGHALRRRRETDAERPGVVALAEQISLFNNFM